MSIPTDSNPELVTVIANARAKAGQEEALREALEALVAPTVAEDGFVTYALHRATDDPAVFYLYENWENVAKFEAHLASPHIAAFLPLVDDLVDGTLTIQPLHRIA